MSQEELEIILQLIESIPLETFKINQEGDFKWKKIQIGRRSNFLIGYKTKVWGSLKYGWFPSWIKLTEDQQQRVLNIYNKIDEVWQTRNERILNEHQNKLHKTILKYLQKNLKKEI